MKFCQLHWEELREAIRSRGIYDLVPKTAEGAVERMKRDFVPKPALDFERAVEPMLRAGDFDPLMGAHNAIVSNVLGVVGLNLMTPNPDGTEKCPICYVVHGCPCTDKSTCTYKTWITSAADDMLALARIERPPS